MKHTKTAMTAHRSGVVLAAAIVSLLSFVTGAFAQDADTQNDNNNQATAPANPTFGGAIAPAPVDSGATAPDQNAPQAAPDQGGQAAGMAAGALQKLNSMTPQQRTQLMNQGQAAAQSVTPQDVEALKAKLAAQWESMTPEQQQAFQAQLLQNASVAKLQQYVIDHVQNVTPEQKQVIIDAVRKSGQPAPPVATPVVPQAQ